MGDSQDRGEETVGTSAIVEKHGDEFVCTCRTQPPIVAKGATFEEAVALLKAKVSEAVRDGVVDSKDLERLSESAPEPDPMPFSRDAKKVLDDALKLAEAAGEEKIGLEHLSEALARFRKGNAE